MNEETSMDQLFIEKVHEAIENNLANENFGVDELARAIGISRSQLHRKLKYIKCSSASQMIKEYRLKKAFELLQQKVATAAEISYQVGFRSPSYFNTCFNEYFGYPPGKVKRIRSSVNRNIFSISRKYRFIALATLVIVAAVIVMLLEIRITDKSVAVLPFRYLSDVPEEQYLADALWNAILLQLSKIEDLRVMSGTSVEQYRNTDKTAAQICKEQNVAFLVDGSFQKIDDQVRLIVQLIRPGKKGYKWAEQYDRNWDDIFLVQSEVAMTIASKLQAIITPEEKLLIDRIPATNLTAVEFYQKATTEHQKHWLKWNDMEAVERAEKLYHLALEYDSTFAQAYYGLAMVYWHKHCEDVLSENYLDSMLILANIALLYDDKLANAYKAKGDYYGAINDKEQAIKEYEKAIKLNPNNWAVYVNSTNIYDDEVKIIEYLLKAASLHRGYFLSRLCREIAFNLSIYSKEKSYYYLEEALKLDDDSADHFRTLFRIEERSGNFEKAIEFGKKSYVIDSTDYWVIGHLGRDHTYIDHYKESLEYYIKYEKRFKTLGRHVGWPYLYRIGHAYWIIGYKEESECYFNKGLENLNKMIELNQIYVQDFHLFYNLAAIYACQGDKDKAFENLRILNQRQRLPIWMVANIKNDPMFDSIRDELEFQQIVKDIEAKYLAEHNRVRKRLEEQGML